MSALVAGVVTVALCPLVLGAARRLGIIDCPNGRSSHLVPTPKAGGLAPVMGATAGVLVAGRLGGDAVATVLIGALLFAAIGLADDLRDISVRVRLAGQLAVALVGVRWLLADLASPGTWRLVVVAATVVWVVGYVNAFNFMDGVNGMAVALVAVAGATWWALAQWRDLPDLAGAAALVALAALGFLPFNVPAARIFLGDVGSYFFGAWLALVVVLGLRAGIAPEAMVGPLVLSLADTSTTVARRLVRGEPWWQGHREHVYQRLVQHGWSHVRTTAAVAGLMAVAAALGAVSEVSSTPARVLADVGLVGVTAAYLALPQALARARLCRPLAA